MSSGYISFCLSAAVLTTVCLGEDWPSWRGLTGDGICNEADTPVKWSTSENIVWKTPIPGTGHSSPIISAGRIFLTSANSNSETRVLVSLDSKTGKILWNRDVLKAPPEKINNLNSLASSTPAADGKHVWVTFLNVEEMLVVCYDFDGNEIWRVTPGRFTAKHGYCSSLLLYQDLVIINGDQDAKDGDTAYIVALEKDTGKERWRIDRPNRVRSYVPPVVFNAGGRDQMVLSGSLCTASYDPKTGKQNWLVEGPTEQFVASMVYADDVFCITGGYPTLHTLGISPDGNILWHNRKEASYVPSPIAAGKYFFVVGDKGEINCLRARTGEVMWSEKFGIHHSASPVSAGGKLYFLDDDGIMYVIDAAPEYRLISTNVLGEPCRASPAISNGKIFIRGTQNLYCIGK